jgi:hypothetical protein
MTFTPTQIKVATYGGAALLLWLLAKNAMAATTMPIVGRVTKELVIDDDVNSPTFGLSAEQIAAMNTSNPAVDPEMRRLIDTSNALIAADDRENGDVNQVGF